MLLYVKAKYILLIELRYIIRIEYEILGFVNLFILILYSTFLIIKKIKTDKFLAAHSFLGMVFCKVLVV